MAASTTNRVRQTHGKKRKRAETPLKKVSNLKSPYKSPLYKCSPYVKRIKRCNHSGLKSPYRHLVQNVSPCKFKSASPANRRKNKDQNGTRTSKPKRTLFRSSPKVTSTAGDGWADCVDSSSGTASADECEFPDRIEEQVSAQEQDENPSTQFEKMYSLIQNVMSALAEHDGMDLVMVRFFEMVSEKTFPLDTTAFLLWIEVVKWYDCSSTTCMRYTNETKQFWKLGWIMFGKRFVNFMGGFKSHGDTVLKMADRGHYDPKSSEINFAVPEILTPTKLKVSGSLVC